MKLIVGSDDLEVQVQGLHRFNQHTSEVSAGSIAAVLLGGSVAGYSPTWYIKNFSSGQVISEANYPCKVVTTFVAQIIFIASYSMKVGYSPIFYIHLDHAQCKLTKFISKIDKRTGKVLEEAPETLNAGDAAIVEVTPLSNIQVEVFSQFPQLGRVIICDNDNIIGVGVVKRVESQQSANQLVMQFTNKQ